jgi:ribosomal protein S18 acetylase RimI-like enzyme
MSSINLYKLDNPVWYALNETHQQFAIGNSKLKRYDKAIALFAGYDDSVIITTDEMDEVIKLGEFCFFINKLPALSNDHIIEKKITCPQMVFQKQMELNIPTVDFRRLTEKDDEKILALIQEVYPGYYKRGTRLLGDYFGIFDNERLAAISGERIRMNGFTEISAVVTHPDYAGRKYAQCLVMHLVNKNLSEDSTPFLHTEDTNQRAIRLYEHLGFVTRKYVDVWKIKRKL